MRGVTGGKRPRGVVTSAESQGGSVSSLPWAGRVPKPAMDADSLVDYGSGFLRKSCDSCVSSKRRCDGQDPCTRCHRRKKLCHYTERKKCGPRSGQKTSKSARRARLEVSSPTSSTASQQSPTTRVANEQQAQHQYDAISKVPSVDTTGRLLAIDALEWQCAGINLSPRPPPHAHPALSADDLSGETTGLDYTDVSDAPPLRYLSRDESGSSWWSQEEQQPGMGMGMVPMGQGMGLALMGQQHGGYHMPGGASGTGTLGGWHPSPIQAHAAMQAAAWNAGQSGRRFPMGAALASTHHHEYPHHQPQQHQQHAMAVHNQDMMVSEWGSQSRSGGAASSTASGMRVNCGNSVADSSEEDDASEAGLGQEEEEVAAMLVSLGQPRTYYSQEAGALNSRAKNDAAFAAQHASSANQHHGGWATGAVYGC